MGLEDRLLARIAAEPPRRVTCWPAAAIAAAAVIVLAMVISALYSRKPPESVRNRQSPWMQRVQPPESGSASPPIIAAGSGQPHPARRAGCCVSSRPGRKVSAGMEFAPKLATFPAPHPQTAQERMLARLAARRGSYEVANM